MDAVNLPFVQEPNGLHHLPGWRGQFFKVGNRFVNIDFIESCVEHSSDYFIVHMASGDQLRLGAEGRTLADELQRRLISKASTVEPEFKGKFVEAFVSGSGS